jgi:cell division protein FtsZ
MAITSPLLETSIDGARGILFNIIGGPNMSMTEVNEAAKIIAEAADADANIIFGATIKNEMKDDIKISVIATGFDESRRRLQGFVSRSQSPFIPNQSGPTRPTYQPLSRSNHEFNEEPPMQQQQQSQPNPEVTKKIQHTEVDIADELDIPAFLRNK